MHQQTKHLQTSTGDVRDKPSICANAEKEEPAETNHALTAGEDATCLRNRHHSQTENII